MMEIAISLAIIGIALVAIIGVLPIGMNVQQDNRQETIINQDANVLIEDIRNGALGANDLTNYVFNITNNWASFNNGGVLNKSGQNTYTFSGSSIVANYYLPAAVNTMPLTNAANIIGILSTPEFTDFNGNPINTLFNGGYSNHIVASVYSISGPAAEKPPQDNPLMQQDSMAYRLFVVNAPVPFDTNNVQFISANDSSRAFADQMNNALRELRLTFLYPLLPNGHLGAGTKTFRTSIAGQLVFQPNIGSSAITYNTNLYVYQSQSFTEQSMKKKLSHPVRRLPIDFGDEPVFLIPIQKWARPRRRGCKSSLPITSGNESLTAEKSNGRPTASPPYACAPGGEGGLKKSILFDSNFKIQHSKLTRRGFTLVEILVVLALLSLIVFALMAVFGATQRAFRASLTQSDTLEGGRSVMDLIAGDLEGMIPSGGPGVAFVNVQGFNPNFAPVNFSCNLKTNSLSPLYQSLIGSPSGALRTNLLEDIFIFSKGNINGVSSWIGTGYAVTTNLADGTLYPLYRFYMTTNAASGPVGQFALYTNFVASQYTNSGLWSHLMDGVVNLTARTYDTNGVWMTNGYYTYTTGTPFIPVQNATFIGTGLGETSCFFVSNAVPASVGIVLGTLEDHVLRHAEGLGSVNQSSYLANSVGQVHLFTRRVWIRNLDPAAYQFP